MSLQSDTGCTPRLPPLVSHVVTFASAQREAMHRGKVLYLYTKCIRLHPLTHDFFQKQYCTRMRAAALRRRGHGVAVCTPSRISITEP